MKTFTIQLSKLKTPRDICRIMEKKGTKHYTYTFQTPTEIIKEGKAADNEWMSGTWGNRLYRQSGGVAGWSSSELFDSSALKMRYLMEKFFPSVSKDEVLITVRDHTQDLIGEDEVTIKQVLLNEEDKRVQAHIRKYGVPPKLNIQKTKSKPRPIVNLFE